MAHSTTEIIGKTSFEIYVHNTEVESGHKLGRERKTVAYWVIISEVDAYFPEDIQRAIDWEK